MDKQRFLALWRRCQFDTSDGEERAEAIFAEVVGHYSGASRHYHNPAHVDHCLSQFDVARDQLDEPDAVEMALWFHDVIYSDSASAGQNERDSAEYFRACARGSLAPSFVSLVHRLIMVTTHSKTPQTNDERYMVDIDLSSFGLPWAAFNRDSEAVRAEFPNVPDALFYEKQRLFMERLLRRDAFCYTEFFRQRYEQQARANITRHLAELSAEGLG